MKKNQKSKIKNQKYNSKLKIIFSFINFGLLIVIFHFALLTFNSGFVFAQNLGYPIPELGNCRNARECYLYCQIPQNTPACWSYNKYILALSPSTLLGIEGLNPDILGEAEVNITYPIPELGNCSSAQDCFLYCSQPQNQTACTAFAKGKGLIKEEDSPEKIPPSHVIAAAIEELGCDGKEACMSLCSLPENHEKCRDFAQRHGLEKRSPKAQEGPPPEVINAAKINLGCDSETMCKSFCDKPENQVRCFEFAKQHNLINEEEVKRHEEYVKKKEELIKEAIQELGCNSAEICISFCEKKENQEKCMKLAQKYGMGPPPNNQSGFKQYQPPPPQEGGNFPDQPPRESAGESSAGQFSEPGPQKPYRPKNCTSEKECREYCQKHPDECPGFIKDKPPQSSFSPDKSPPSGDFEKPYQSGSAVDTMPQPPKDEKFNEGDFLGPGGCKTEAECKAYCEKHPDKCPGFGQGEEKSSQPMQNSPQQSSLQMQSSSKDSLSLTKENK